jgi:FdrA protein
MKRVLIQRNRYYDSVFLMRIGQELQQLPEVSKAIVVMGTPANLDSLRAVGFAPEESAVLIRPNDVVTAIDGTSEDAIDEATDQLKLLLTGRTPDESGPTGTPRPMTISEAVEIDPDVNLALISVPGPYAAREARQALRARLHVMLFSDNVSVEDEISLKDEAIERDLLMMGPDCGTALLNGAPLGFANVVRHGAIGIVGASGTGIQEISSLVHRLGGGISQAIGTGGRDLSTAVKARMTRFGIEALGADPATTVIVVVSKPSAPDVLETVVKTLEATTKRGVVHVVGGGAREAIGDIEFAGTLADAAELACAASGIDRSIPADPSAAVSAKNETAKGLAPVSGHVLGLFCGGTLAQETWHVFHRAGLEVRSNAAADPALKAGPGAEETDHMIWDLGDDAFTVGRPHPMIEPSLRDDKVAQAADDPSVGVILVDCVLGYGAHPDPAGSLANAARRAIEVARQDGRRLLVVASVTGTDEDPQNRRQQVAALTKAGVLVAPSNAAAANWVLERLQGGVG